MRFQVTVATVKIEYVCQGHLRIPPTLFNKLEVICQCLKELNTAGRQGFLVMLNNLSHCQFILLDVTPFGNSHKLAFTAVGFFETGYELVDRNIRTSNASNKQVRSVTSTDSDYHTTCLHRLSYRNRYASD